MWTLPELTAEAATILSAGRPPQVNGRIRDLPNERMIRWYVTIGLVDPPLGRRGRVALYGPRHLLQLVAVKRRQAAGQSIAEIQAELAGATDDTLQEIARIAAHEPSPPAPESGPNAPDAVVARPGAGQVRTGQAAPRRFWAERPRAGAGEQAGLLPGLVHGVWLAPGARLLVDAALSPDDAAAIQAAAGPLLDVLTERGLL